MTTTGAEIHRAVTELQALAAAVRPDWPEHDIRGAILEAATVGLTWQQVLVALPRLMADPHARPAELIPHRGDPLRPAAHHPPTEDYRAARAALEEARHA